MTDTGRVIAAACFGLAALILVGDAIAHNVSREDIELITGNPGPNFALYAWLGAKHMVTGYDHLLFLVGVIFYLKRLRTVAIFASLFALGHSVTLIGGVLLDLNVDPYLVDAIIGLSVAYKGFDNLNGFQTLFGDSPNEQLAVFIFGLFHGLGLATKLQDLGLQEDGLLVNLVSFNIGVEFGQLAALVVFVLLLRALPTQKRGSMVGTGVNVGLILAGFTLMAYQLALYFADT
jgi:hypothetical protein